MNDHIDAIYRLPDTWQWLMNDHVNIHSQETDGQSQRGAAGRRQRYFLAKQVRREHDGGVARVRYRLVARVRACWLLEGVVC